MISAETEQSVLKAVPTQLLIGGRWREARGGRRLPVEDPATNQTLIEVADASPEDGLAALDAAHEEQEHWAKYPPRERAEILRRAFELITARTDDLALLMTLEMGKPLAESRGEVAYGAEFFRWFSEESVRIEGRWAIAPSGQGRLLVMKEPVGPCLFITPWNFPLAMGARKIAPAIAAGCTFIVKPAVLTPLTMLALAAILEDAGLPPGVMSVLTTSRSADLTGQIIKDPRLRKLSFTGSTEVGKALIGQAADQVLRVSMELGGNAPFIVFEDADLDAAVQGALIAKMRNTGEACTSANRFLVAAGIAEDFAGRLAARLGALRLGRGTDDGVEVGPLVDYSTRQKVAALVDDAIERGARVRVGASPVEGHGYFYQPTVLDDVSPDSRLLREEIFGPVAPITSFSSEEAAISAANDTEYGLVAYVFTRDLKRALRVVEALRVGMVGLNQGLVSNPAAPFGGVKQSGFGREGGREGIQEYLDTKYVAVNL